MIITLLILTHSVFAQVMKKNTNVEQEFPKYIYTHGGVGGNFFVVSSDDIKRVMKGIHFYLKKNGKFLITVPTKNIKVIPKHYQHFDLDTLKTVVKNLFEIDDYFYMNKKSIFVDKILKKILVNRFFILNEKRLLYMAYATYYEHFLMANERNASRILLVCKKIE